MDRDWLDKMSAKDLKALAATLKLDIKGNRAALFEAIMEYYERNGWPMSETQLLASAEGNSHMQTGIVVNEGPGVDARTGSVASGTCTPLPFMCNEKTSGTLISDGERNMPSDRSLGMDLKSVVAAVVQVLQETSQVPPQVPPPQNAWESRDTMPNFMGTSDS
ncbi:hypothetical protein KPH14_012853 [Odynerus spinipes]|uniref:SAP domain-containing protein n=1 Tax=Odynerus spinipes TaxID=1348599 RepID=A0AAD9RE81_9HYME|nr:hypothetical protein KPH14_012853 [Odynerus spinipes]